MTRTGSLVVFFLLVACPFSYGQMDRYSYKRELKGVSEQWHKIVLPDGVFGKVSQDLADIRVFGVTTASDTIEAPYLLRLTTGNTSVKKVAFNTLNASHGDKGHYFTFEIPTSEPINQIDLDFRQKNFDWRVRLEGSQSQREWLTILEDYRILSIRNEATDFRFTRLTFPNSKYRFFRLIIESNEKPELVTASISQQETQEGTYRNYPVKFMDAKDNRQTKQTEIDVELPFPVPVSHIKVAVRDTFNYYRPLVIRYLVDSVKTEQGWRHNYQTLTTGTLNSMEENEFATASRTVQKLKVLIENKDNQPLTIEDVQVKGYLHELVVRFTAENASYFLTYGNKTATKPRYDIGHFSNRIPEELATLELGNEQIIEKEAYPALTPLFENKIWLWAIIGVTVVLLGWFSVSMMRK